MNNIQLRSETRAEFQLVEKVHFYKNGANSLSLTPNPFPVGRGYFAGATAPSPCRGLRPCDPVFIYTRGFSTVCNSALVKERSFSVFRFLVFPSFIIEPIKISPVYQKINGEFLYHNSKTFYSIIVHSHTDSSCNYLGQRKCKPCVIQTDKREYPE